MTRFALSLAHPRVARSSPSYERINCRRYAANQEVGEPAEEKMLRKFAQMQSKALLIFSGLWMMAAACSHGPNRATGAITASEEAQRFGIDSYVVAADHVDVYATSGELLGILTVTSPTTDTRTLTLEGRQGPLLAVDVDTPLPDGSFLAPMEDDRAGQILSDPALSGFLATYKLAFKVLDRSNWAPIPGGLDPSALTVRPGCSDITFVSACTAYPTCYGQTEGGTLTAGHTIFSGWGSTWADCGSACDATYGTNPVRYGVVVGSDCRCYDDVTAELDRYAACTASSCQDADFLDQVSKHRTCWNNVANHVNGSCANAAQSWTGQCVCQDGSNYVAHCSAGYECSSGYCFESMTPCGGLGYRCCDGTTCAAGLVCDGGYCWESP